jgi:hypothetical protein
MPANSRKQMGFNSGLKGLNELGKYEMKTNRCHFFNFIHISTDLYMFHTEHAARTVQPLNQWLCEQLCEYS